MAVPMANRLLWERGEREGGGTCRDASQLGDQTSVYDLDSFGILEPQS